jgi:hypothetical protein
MMSDSFSPVVYAGCGLTVLDLLFLLLLFLL